MGTVKIVSWNIEHLERLMGQNLASSQVRRRDAIVNEIRELDADIMCILEGPKGEETIEKVCSELLRGEWVPVKAPDGVYATKGAQWIWFLVRAKYHHIASLLPVNTWDALTEKEWPCCYWGEFKETRHSHYRHPQVMVLDWNGFRVEFIGLHLKSKYVNNGDRMWKTGGLQKERFIREALTARVKMTTEAINVRKYVDRKFEHVPKPALFVMGDFNDGPGKEYFEERFLFFDLISNIQGNVFFASRFLNHALFDFPDNLRWTVSFEDFVDTDRDPHILLDHVLFSQGLVDGSHPWKIDSGAGKVEHEIHDVINATLRESEKTSDHKPISLVVRVED